MLSTACLLAAACGKKAGPSADIVSRANVQRTGVFESQAVSNITEIIWLFDTADMVRCEPVVYNGTVFFGGHDKNLYAVDCKTGKIIWRFTTSASIVSSPAIAAGIAFFGGYDKNL